MMFFIQCTSVIFQIRICTCDVDMNLLRFLFVTFLHPRTVINRSKPVERIVIERFLLQKHFRARCQVAGGTVEHKI